MDGDGKGMVVLALGYQEIIVPVKVAMAFMDCVANGGAYKFDSKWAESGKPSLEIIEPAEIVIKHLSQERVALAKLSGAAYQQYLEERERNKT